MNKHNMFLTKDIFNNLPLDDKIKFPFYCPDNFPYLCGTNSNSFGLCKKTLEDCDNDDCDGVIPITAIDNNNEGIKYGYITANLHKRCKKIILDKNEICNHVSYIPLMFSIMTYNILGLPPKNDFMLKIMNMRMNIIIKTILKNNPDIICFQEMSLISQNILNKRLCHIYKYQYERDYYFDEIDKRNREVETTIYSKYPILNYQVYGLQGNLRYNNSMIRAEYNDFVLYNIYLQAGSKNSPGQENYWFHYTRCRLDQIKRIKELIDKEIKPVIVCGDFNFHLDGGPEWLEKNEIDKYLNDSWRNLKKSDGYTENTNINTMRWNMKFKDKHVRYDGIFYKGKSIKPYHTKLVGLSSLYLNKKMSEKFISQFTTDKNKVKYHNGLIKIFGSDHFGVLCKFILKSI